MEEARFPVLKTRGEVPRYCGLVSFTTGAMVMMRPWSSVVALLMCPHGDCSVLHIQWARGSIYQIVWDGISPTPYLRSEGSV